MLDESGCDNTLRWAKRWRDLCVPEAVTLEHDLERQGGYCDCEIGYNIHPDHTQRAEDEPPPACAGVSRRGCTGPCAR
ncbi:DUF2695 domain-containing protein [Amycolatopsis aidingensis]|uniref:DUF2695 domain-containing protein n=1 Tax=Amycolatopsis aidingensis TaxID=2842453 RepID=UPI001C0DFB71|nr:DUF2695 domain-containing protein [Amycolatopsis aidingensis]